MRCTVDRVIDGTGMAWARDAWHCIIEHESDWNPNATGLAGERGLTQIHPIHVDWLGWDRWGRMYDPAANIEAAIELYHRAGDSFSPWTTRHSCGV